MHAVICLSDGKVVWCAKLLVSDPSFVGFKFDEIMSDNWTRLKAMGFARDNPGKVYHAVRLLSKVVLPEGALDEHVY